MSPDSVGQLLDAARQEGHRQCVEDRMAVRAALLPDLPTLRDQLAMAALPWAIPEAANYTSEAAHWAAGSASRAYEIADAMLKAREQ